MKLFYKQFIFSSFFCFSIYLIVIALLSGIDLKKAQLPINLKTVRGERGHQFSRLSEVKYFKNIDILILGSSNAYRGFDPRIFKQNGFTIFNLGSSAQTPNQTDFLINKYLNQLNPKVVIYAISPIALEIDGVESMLDLISNETLDEQILFSTLSYKKVLLLNSFLYQLFRKVFRLDVNYTEYYSKDLDTYISGGYVQRVVTPFNTKDYESKKRRLNAELLTKFSNVCSLVTKRGLKLVLIQTPVHNLKFDDDFDLTDFTSIMSDFEVNLDYSNDNRFHSDSLFMDNVHLNQNGVDLFNPILIDSLKKLAILN